MKYGNFVLDGIRDFDKECFGYNGKDEKCECERCEGRGWLYAYELSEEEKEEYKDAIENSWTPQCPTVECPDCKGEGEI